MIAPKPKNQWALVIWHLLQNHSKGIDMADMSRDYFYKFQSRLGEVEKTRKNKLKIVRLRMKGKNRFGHDISWINYKSLAHRSYLINLIAKLNRIHASKEKV